ncbi:DNA-processing protein DprA [Rubrivivax rivuli]|uniref:DNA-protecting protein DprA n=1 Tax=Rubrivivax rivuli TaxID=1862385 RepID=A0A437RLV3_9BURK|nr:DNA-processing protein DprA [Rubrivivax rivuli]RVU47767.1 DNA-protecting protein DprA [Rubrivivax rivuli]
MAPLDDAEFAAWFRLLETPGLGREKVRRLLAALGEPAAVLESPPAVLRDVLGPKLAEALQHEPPDFAARLRAARAWLHGGEQRHVLTLSHPAWPPLLLQAADAPLLLYAEGDLAALSAPCIAVVGSRQPTAQGRDNAGRFARELASAGWVVVSGLAQGVDAAAHEGALAAGGRTVAVVGTGLDQCYPTGHRALARRIAAQGTLLSEYAPGTPPLAEHFPQRNRLIAALARGTLVVEAALRSGSLITARLANEAGREVWAIPGSIHAPQSRGCHALIKQGAALVECVQDMLDELEPSGGPDLPAAETSNQAGLPWQPATAAASADPLLAALGDDPMTLDTLLARTGEPTAVLNARLLELELAGQVARLPGGLFQRRHSA